VANSGTRAPTRMTQGIPAGQVMTAANACIHEDECGAPARFHCGPTPGRRGMGFARLRSIREPTNSTSASCGLGSGFDPESRQAGASRCWAEWHWWITPAERTPGMGRDFIRGVR